MSKAIDNTDELILDTHAWIWWVNQDNKLPIALHERIAGSKRVAISAASIYELIQTVERGRLALSLDIESWLHAATVESGIDVIPVNAQIAQTAGELPPIHGDPLDRFIIATALTTRQSLLSLDGKFVGYSSLAGLLITR